jgi:hypothetical protein
VDPQTLKPTEQTRLKDFDACSLRVISDEPTNGNNVPFPNRFRNNILMTLHKLFQVLESKNPLLLLRIKKTLVSNSNTCGFSFAVDAALLV